MSCDWRDAEPGLAGAAVELRRVLRRGLARAPIAVALAAAVAAVGIVAWTRPLPATARALLRVTESRLASGHSLLSRADLATYVADVVLRDASLAAVADRHRLYPDALGPAEKARAARDALRIEVYRNYFAIDRDAAGGLRSARVRITFTHSDPRLATRVANDLADLVVAVDAERRRSRVARNLLRADDLYAAAAAALDEHERALIERMAANRAAGSTDPALLDAQLAGASATLAADWQLLRAADRARADASLRALGEQHTFDVRFEVAGVRGPGDDARPRSHVAALALAIFVLSLPVSLVGLGAFDGVVRDMDDLRRRGFDALARLPGRRRTP